MLDWIFDIRFVMNLDYVLLRELLRVLTIILPNIEVYVCQKGSLLHKHVSRISIAVKGVLYVCAMCVNGDGHGTEAVRALRGRGVMYHIYEMSTIMFFVFPCFILVMLDSFILTISKLMDGAWPSEDTGRFVFLGERRGIS